MEALSLTKYASISNYKKCGEILKSQTIGEKQYAMLCLQCNEICLQFQTFVLHMEKEHTNCFLNVKTEDENLDVINEDGHIVSNSYDQYDTEEVEDNKELVMDFCAEPVVLLPNPTCTNLTATHRKIQNKIGAEKHVKQEPEEYITRTAIDTSKKFVNTSLENGKDVVNVKMKRFEDERNNSIKISRLDSSDDDDDIDNHYMDEYDEDEDIEENDKVKAPPVKKSINISKFGGDDDDFHNDYMEDDDEDENIEENEIFSDKVKAPPVEKSQNKIEFDIDIDEFMQNENKVLQFIKSYQKQDELWDATRPPKLVNRCRKKREQCLNAICKEMEQAMVQMTIKDAEKCIRYMRNRYIREERIRANCRKIKGKIFKPLWFHEHLNFLKPTLGFIQELENKETFVRTELNDEQVIELIGIYKAYPCLWDEQHVYYNSEKRRRETLQNILVEIKEKLHLDFTPTEVKEKIEFVHKIVREEKENIFVHNANKPDEEYKSTCKFYKHIEFLFEHLGPFKCQFCLKIIPHIYPFRSHTAKHDGSKPFKCSLCQFEFTQKPAYVRHLHRHLQDFPFVCDICGKGFVRKTRLTDHLNAHKNIKRSICKICGKGFTNSRLLCQHRRVHSQKRSVCKLCGKSYAHNTNLYGHLSKDHGTTLSEIMGKTPRSKPLTFNDINC